MSLTQVWGRQYYWAWWRMAPACCGSRRELATTHGVPPYVIFHNETLREMAELRPLSREQLRGITGIGERKLEEYGESFLAIIDRLVRGG